MTMYKVNYVMDRFLNEKQNGTMNGTVTGATDPVVNGVTHHRPPGRGKGQY